VGEFSLMGPMFTLDSYLIKDEAKIGGGRTIFSTVKIM
jgi:hypothetical protein